MRPSFHYIYIYIYTRIRIYIEDVSNTKATPVCVHFRKKGHITLSNMHNRATNETENVSWQSNFKTSIKTFKLLKRFCNGVNF